MGNKLLSYAVYTKCSVWVQQDSCHYLFWELLMLLSQEGFTGTQIDLRFTLMISDKTHIELNSHADLQIEDSCWLTLMISDKTHRNPVVLRILKTQIQKKTVRTLGVC